MNREGSQPCVSSVLLRVTLGETDKRQGRNQRQGDQLEGSRGPPRKKVEGGPEIADSSEIGKEQMLRKELTQSDISVEN